MGSSGGSVAAASFFRWFPWMDIAPNEEFWGVFYPAL